MMITDLHEVEKIMLRTGGRKGWLFRTLPVLLLAAFVAGCGNATTNTRVMVSKTAVIQQYDDLLLIPPKQDPKHLVTKVADRFRGLGMQVTVHDRKKPIFGYQGTGFLITRQGHVLTCAHVLGEDDEATLWISGKRFIADVIDKDKKKDLAVLKIRNGGGTGLRPMSFRKEKRYSMGEDVFTIGYPLSSMLGNTARLSKGLISATRGMRDDPNQLQFSAGIQPGNSGGPLFDNHGVVVGVVQKTLNPLTLMKRTGGAIPQNVNFAIKTDIVLEYLKSRPGNLYSSLEFEGKRTFDEAEKSVAKVRSGIKEDDKEKKKPRLIAILHYSNYGSYGNLRYFIISFYDYDTRKLLFRTYQQRASSNTEDEVIDATFLKVRETLRK